MMPRYLDKTLLAEVQEQALGGSSEGTRVSIFGIIVVGLIAGLIVGLITTHNTTQGFFLGFAGGALITVALYFFKTEKSRPTR
ncbi:hypothetical protein E6H26_00465 [Candidatus Bathyarchaeota archaeon]|nr:MAG: hypothetical protein E6H26_00465 [Candidatus Bathyarchaeota archaeon]